VSADQGAPPKRPRLRLYHRPRSVLERRLQHAIATRRAFWYLAGATAALTLAVGFVMTIVDEDDFPTFGDAVWWAVQTLSTVGYGDIVPHSAWGRLLGAVVIVLGVTFIAFLTAIVTSLFVGAEARERAQQMEEERVARDEALLAALSALEKRLDAIEAGLSRPEGPSPG
jgi:voltage-gated potassium channel